MSSLVTFQEAESGIATITLNNPDSLNAMDEAMAVEFRQLIDQLKLRAGSALPKVLVLTGSGRAFSAGGNLEMLKKKHDLSFEENRARMMNFYRSFLCMLDLPVPLVAAVNGHAIGAGLCLATACDLRVVAQEAKLGMTFAKLGLHPGMGATYFLPRILGANKAAEYMLTGKVMKGEEFKGTDFASAIVPSASVLETATDLAAQIASCGPQSIRSLVSTLRGSQAGLYSALEREALCQSKDYLGTEFLEGVNATMEKRKPNF